MNTSLSFFWMLLCLKVIVSCIKRLRQGVTGFRAFLCLIAILVCSIWLVKSLLGAVL